jgi:hypothetical protein
MRQKKKLTLADRQALGDLRGTVEAMTEAHRERDALIWRLRDAGVSPEDVAAAAGLHASAIYKIPRPPSQQASGS